MGIFHLIFFAYFAGAGPSQVSEIPKSWESRRSELEALEPKKVEIGEKLFFDTSLSKNNTMSCATCHMPTHAFSNGKDLAKGFDGTVGDYNVPVIFNRLGTKLQFWDGRVTSLKEQILQPVFHPGEMGLDEAELVKRMNASAYYRGQFDKKITKEDVVDALATFVSSLITTDSRYDKYMNGNPGALTSEEVEGRRLFFETYKCSECHAGSNFSVEDLRPRCGIPVSPDNMKYGQSFKVPTLRNLDKSGPYLHSGKLHRLSEVLEFYALPSRPIPAKDRQLIIKFLGTLNSEVVIYKKKN